MSKFAKVIIDISADSVDRAFSYIIPEELKDDIKPGMCVEVPFGNSKKPRKAYVTELTDVADFEENKLKSIIGAVKNSIDPESVMIELAQFMAQEYGSTMNQALKTVLPVKKTVRKNKRRTDPVEEINKISDKKGNLAAEREGSDIELNEAQRAIADSISKEIDELCSEKGVNKIKPSLIYGITGSGKTQVYIELIDHVVSKGEKAIVLIPEISLTYQTVSVLASHFGDRVAVLHSKLSQGERFEQYEKARKGLIDVMVGPRSAIFTPFDELGIIIIDEEHERSYCSDTTPRYDVRTVAAKRAELCKAKLVLGSATPSVESYQRALQGEYELHVLKERAVKGSKLPKVHTVDLRDELAKGNRSIFSDKLRTLISDRLSKNEQIMLFINRRGYAGFVSCRSCGYVVKCPHCDVSLTAHNNWYFDKKTNRKSALLSCHYCGYQKAMPLKCPICQSPYIAPFGTGTQKLEQAVRKGFPQAKVLRMDADTTSAKFSHEQILSQFAKGEDDILIGTQMIVKGHDFPKVTLVGIIAADLSLNSPDYDAAERSFQLITQAAGRAGRADLEGDVVIQSYAIDHYAIETAAKQDYESFYRREMSYRKLMNYPPFTYMLSIRLQSDNEERLEAIVSDLSKRLNKKVEEMGGSLIGPCNASVYKVKDVYRKLIYIRHTSHDDILLIRNMAKEFINDNYKNERIYLSYDLK
ncbi:MAG: primosomal protein N' [Eubacteriales bacterium]|nr:primosomal protein N' [Eubacteriales bacterium]